MPVLMSKTITATGVAFTGRCQLWGIVINDTTALGNTFYIYDALGTTNLFLKLKQAAPGNQIVMFKQPLSIKTGIYLSVSGALCTATFLIS